MAAKIRVAVVDDHPMFREGVAQALCSAEDLELVAEGASAADAVEIAQDHLPDILLLDINMPGGGLEAVRTISRQCPRVKVMMLTVSENEDHVSSTLQAGAHAYILKGISGPDFLKSVRAVHDGSHYVTPNLAARLLSRMGSRSAEAGEHSNGELPILTPREEEILRLVALSCEKEEIAERLEMSEKAVSDYMANILQKLQFRTRMESILAARRR